MLTRTFLCLFLALWSTAALRAQTVETTVSKVISSKAAKGSLYDYTDDGDQIKLTYLIKETKKALQIETYTFDKATLQFASIEESEVSKTSFKSKSGDSKGSRLLRVYPNLAGKPKIKLGYMRYTYYPRWTDEKFIATEELTPKGDAGEKMFYVHHRTEEADNNEIKLHGSKKHKLNIGDVQLIGLVDEAPNYTSYSSLVIAAKDLEVTSRTNFHFEYSYLPISAENLPNGDLGIVFRSFTIKDFPKPKHSQKLMAKFKLAPKYHLKYVQVNTEGEIVQDVNIDFEAPESGYTLAIDVVASDSDNEVMLMGSSRPLKLLGPPLGRMGGPKATYNNHKSCYTHKAERLFIARIKDNKQVYSKTYAIDQLLSHIVLAEGASAPKNITSYLGKYAQVQAAPTEAINNGGKTMIMLQIGSEGQHVVQLSPTGEIEANYIIALPKGRAVNRYMEAYVNSKGELHLFTYHQKSVKKDATSEQQQKAAEARTGLVFKIDPIAKTLNTPVNLTPEATLDFFDPFFFENQDTIVTLGNGRKKEIVLSRIRL